MTGAVDHEDHGIETDVREKRLAARQPLAPAPVAMGGAPFPAPGAGETALGSAARQQATDPGLHGNPGLKAGDPGPNGRLGPQTGVGRHGGPRAKAGQPRPQVTPAPSGALDRRAWPDEAVERLGLPQTIRDAIAGIDDDMACLQAAASAVATLCRPLPAGVPLLVGPEAGTLSPALGVPLVLPPGPAPAQGPVAAAVGGTQLDWVARVRGHRWVHLVVGGPGWAGLAGTSPLAVSWAEATDLPAALRLAADEGLVLGYDGTRGVRRASPVDVAVALREMVVAR